MNRTLNSFGNTFGKVLTPHAVILAVLVAIAVPATAQEQEVDRPEPVATAKGDATLQVAAGKSAMSPVSDRDLTLETSDELVTQSTNTVMTAGTCLVIDDFVRQFCTANPDDISCQFQ